MSTVPSAYFASSISDFLDKRDEEIVGQMTLSNQFDLVLDQRDAWSAQLPILRQTLHGLNGTLFLEFELPRLGSRVDAVVLLGPAVIPIEFKIGESHCVREHVYQAWDYGLDFKNFHEGSHRAPVFPIVVASRASKSDRTWAAPHADLLYPPAWTNPAGLRPLIDGALRLATGPALEPEQWGHSLYRPTPTIIEAARSLYAQHTVEAITRSEAGAINIQSTSKRVEEIIDETRSRGGKAVIFVTGVPGAGKTLVGLNVANQRRDAKNETHAVFLSGNGPLVAVLREALVRDEVSRQATLGTKVRKGDVATKVKQFIQNVHHFRDAGVKNDAPPSDHVVIFDEAQRAWDRKQTSKFMRNRKKITGFNQSEPEFLLSYMNRRLDWAVVVCLVGGGQEIHHGEAGIAEWLTAVREHFPEWHLYLSPELSDSEYAAGTAVELAAQCHHLRKDTSLHLAVSMRSFRSERLAGFVKRTLDCDTDAARAELHALGDDYPIVLTRDLDAAKHWVRSKARGNERIGLVASSQAERLKPHAIDVRVDIDPIHWFLNPADDTRSSYYLEDAATEFDIQGLELDWVCMTWDADLRFATDTWSFNRFRGSKWQTLHDTALRQYLLNAYRVLLTRARQGMAIFVPTGSVDDPTRRPQWYDATYEYLAGLGLRTL